MNLNDSGEVEVLDVHRIVECMFPRTEGCQDYRVEGETLVICELCVQEGRSADAEVP